MKTKEEIIKCFYDKLKEELTDVDAYNSIYESLLENDLHWEAHQIEEIAQDELAHAERLRYVLEEGYQHDFTGDKDMEALWHRAKKAFQLV